MKKSNTKATVKTGTSKKAGFSTKTNVKAGLRGADSRWRSSVCIEW